MSIRTIRQRVPALEITEGAGVTVHRSIGTPALRNLDPFLMLDHFGSDNPDEYIAGFPDHPHRGFITFTYMLDGHMEHRDSMGNQGQLKAGGVQWMKAASGVIHSEMPQQVDGLMRGFQLWINLPARDKMSDPAYQEFSAAAIPEVARAHARVRVLAGEFDGTRGVIDDPATDVVYLDVALEAGARFAMPLADTHHGFVYVFEGSARLADDNPGPAHAGGAGRGRHGRSRGRRRRRALHPGGWPPHRRTGGAVRPLRDEHARGDRAGAGRLPRRQTGAHARRDDRALRLPVQEKRCRSQWSIDNLPGPDSTSGISIARYIRGSLKPLSQTL